jgi:hypothetical protein
VLITARSLGGGRELPPVRAVLGPAQQPVPAAAA